MTTKRPKTPGVTVLLKDRLTHEIRQVTLYETTIKRVSTRLREMIAAGDPPRRYRRRNLTMAGPALATLRK